MMIYQPGENYQRPLPLAMWREHRMENLIFHAWANFEQFTSPLGYIEPSYPFWEHPNITSQQHGKLARHYMAVVSGMIESIYPENNPPRHLVETYHTLTLKALRHGTAARRQPAPAVVDEMFGVETVSKILTRAE